MERKYKKKLYHKNFDVPTSIQNRNLLSIINFYLIQCPVPDVSARGVSLEAYGFKGKKSVDTLRKTMLGAATESLKANYKACTKEELEDYILQMETVSPPDEYCVFLKSSKGNQVLSLLYAIRNAFAHGSYNVKSYNGTRIYFLLNQHNKCKKAQIVLQEKTLLAWLRIIRSGYDNLCGKNT